ncbi:hypothetical protein Hanom_Chr05g00409951 [Helianthus anomalus]
MKHKISLVLYFYDGRRGTNVTVHVEDSVVVGRGQKTSSEEAGDFQGSLRVNGLSDDGDDEDLESHLIRNRKADQASSPKVGSQSLEISG